jgi:hypothetical protein
MRRAIFIAAILIGVLSAAGRAHSSAPSTVQRPLNIGFVLYTKGDAPGTLKARWRYTTEYSGTGVATGGPAEGFAGHYHVRYFDEHGNFSDEYDLVIERNGDFYSGSWLTKGKVSARGVGMKVQEGVAIGWRRIAD